LAWSAVTPREVAARRDHLAAEGNRGREGTPGTSVIVAGSATMDGMSYQGTAQVPTASGTLTMMKLTMSSLTLTGGVRATVTQNGQTTVTANSSLDFSGGVVLYVTELSGSLLGVPITLTPGTWSPCYSRC
jgi:hypothetical protein